MAYTDLTTYSEVQARAMEADATIDAEQAEVEAIITEASTRIASYLNRDVIATAHKQRIYRNAWAHEPIGGSYVAWADQWPVVEVLTDGYSRLDDRKIEGNTDDVLIEYVAGYIRADQSLTDVQGRIPDATQTPDTLPTDIRNVCIRLVLYEVAETADDSLGLGQKEQAIGGANTLTVRGRDSAFYSRELAKLDRYKRRIKV